jgi:hypothetical protein
MGNRSLIPSQALAGPAEHSKAASTRTLNEHAKSIRPAGPPDAIHRDQGFRGGYESKCRGGIFIETPVRWAMAGRAYGTSSACAA